MLAASMDAILGDLEGLSFVLKTPNIAIPFVSKKQEFVEGELVGP